MFKWSRYVLRSLFRPGYAFGVVVVVTFEAEGWLSRILAEIRASGRFRNAPRRFIVFRLYDYVPMLQICSSTFVSY
jgi:hypothetical protein